MIVGNRMTKEPITVGPDDLLIRASHRMQAGGFRRVPVVSEGKLIGIVTERDLREHHGHLEHTKINGAMTENPLTVTPATTLEEATKILLERQVGGLPVVADGRLIGIITASDILNAFLDVMGASHGGSTRMDLVLEGEEHGLVEATRISLMMVRDFSWKLTTLSTTSVSARKASVTRWTVDWNAGSSIVTVVDWTMRVSAP